MSQDETRHEDRLQRRNRPMEVVVEDLHANGLSLGVRVIHPLLMPAGTGRRGKKKAIFEAPRYATPRSVRPVSRRITLSLIIPEHIPRELIEQDEESETLARVGRPGVEVSLGGQFHQIAEFLANFVVQRRTLAEPKHHRLRQRSWEPVQSELAEEMSEKTRPSRAMMRSWAY